MRSRIVPAAALLAAMTVFSGLAAATVIPVASNSAGFTIISHRVNVKIDRQIASTEVDHVFRNDGRTPMEGNYIFPVAEGASISKLSLLLGGVDWSHRLLTRDEARLVYTDMVRSRRDPALLEWLGTGMIQARLLPVQPNEEKRVRIGYQQALKAEGGVVKYVYPLKSERVSGRPLNDLSVTIEILSAQPIRSVYSPSHNVSVRRDGERRALITYTERNSRPEDDLILYYTVSEKDLGLDLLTYRDSAGDGYFLMLAAPKADLKQSEVQPKDVVFVIDVSGSMSSDNKIEQAKAAMKFCVNSLDSRDRFSVIAFSTDIRSWRPGLQAASRDNVKDAESFIGELKAQGGTNISESLRAAMDLLGAGTVPAAGSRPSVLVFMTDGLPTVGDTNTESMLAQIRNQNKARVRIFDFGVGNDVNTHFLDRLANDNSGYAVNVRPKEDIEIKVSDFFGKVSSPLLMNLKADWGGAEVYDLYPHPLPDLFQGSQLIVVGRYKTKGDLKSAIRLSGDMNGKRQTFAYEARFPEKASADDFIPRLWATRKIGYLEDEIRLHGANRELVEEVIRLSKEHAILTEYTSFLVDVDPRVARSASNPASGIGLNNRLGVADLEELAAQTTTNVERLRSAEARGGAGGTSGVSQSLNRKDMKDASQAASAAGNTVLSASGEKVQLNGIKSVSQRSFVQNGGNQWVDVNYKNTNTLVTIKAFSPAYFQIANAHPRMAQYMSLSDDVVIVLKDTAIHVSPAGRENEFTAVELKDIRAKMDAEFGPPPTPSAAPRIAALAEEHERAF